MRLSDREWKIFIIGDLFSIKRPIARNKDHYENGNVPFVASGSGNNGVMKCCKPHKNEELDNAGCITVSPVDGSAFYQLYNFLGRGGAGSSILMLYADNINLYNGQFIAKMIANTCACKYTYGHMGNKDSIKRERIMLPVDDNDEPDYQFMEDYMKELMTAKRKQYQKYVEQRLAEFGIDDMKIPMRGGYNLDLESREWKKFNINDIFVVGHGFYNKKPPMSENGKFPFIGASGENNGVTGFTTKKDVENNSKLGYGTNEPLDKKIFSKGHLCVVNNGSAIGYTYYQPDNFTCTHDVNPLWLRSCKMNKYLGLFLSQMIKNQGICFAYARKWRPSRMVHSCVMLPVNDNNEPDYEFMEECGRQMMAKKYIQYLKYLESTCESSDLLLK